MSRLLLSVVAVAVVAVPGAWTRLPAAPLAVDAGLASVWTGKEMIVFGRAHRTAVKSVNVAAAYDPAARTWRRLSPPLGASGSFQGHYSAVWTGSRMLVWGPATTLAYTPATGRWRSFPRSPTGRAGALTAWTGRELIGWGGGCCGDAFSDGAAYRPATDSWRKLAPAPLAGGQEPGGGWTGRELIVFGVRNPDGPPLRTAAAYNPKTDTWRRIAPLPAPRYGAKAFWDGRELLVVGGGSAVGFAYRPATNRWRALPRTAYPLSDIAAAWTGKRLLVWRGPRKGLSYDPKRNRWAALPTAPIVARRDPTSVWTGRAFIVWGGLSSVSGARSDGAILSGGG